ncbi:uncharacterized protein LOC120637188 [Pararge aegeria]|uniref:Jg4978 protein n=2 Tax=Pararge aegeria TaxID=116150 RepID=A0A8S4R2R3_9NEOP|nr:uncharacterized protein LOC120637188 [Pararge aegeria]CAH2227701.1 jg4978 [Pararge aegeria aegeria]
MKKYSIVGNKKKVTMENNPTSLKVIGNNCIVRVTGNQGEIEVIGNDCKIDVTDNFGTINLVGSGGIVTVHRRWTGDNVSMVGPNCHLMVDGKDKSSAPHEAQLSPFSKDLDDVIESIFSFVMR